jgi:hypothetical protein
MASPRTRGQRLLDAGPKQQDLGFGQAPQALPKLPGDAKGDGLVVPEGRVAQHRQAQQLGVVGAKRLVRFGPGELPGPIQADDEAGR